MWRPFFYAAWLQHHITPRIEDRGRDQLLITLSIIRRIANNLQIQDEAVLCCLTKI